MIANKLFALFIIVMGILVMRVDRDATFLLFTSAIGIPTFFSKDKRIW
jgi:hypothetical protein